MFTLKVFLPRLVIVAAALGFVAAVGCQNPDEFYRFGTSGNAGSGTTGAAGDRPARAVTQPARRAGRRTAGTAGMTGVAGTTGARARPARRGRPARRHDGRGKRASRALAQRAPAARRRTGTGAAGAGGRGGAAGTGSAGAGGRGGADAAARAVARHGGRRGRSRWRRRGAAGAEHRIQVVAKCGQDAASTSAITVTLKIYNLERPTSSGATSRFATTSPATAWRQSSSSTTWQNTMWNMDKSNVIVTPTGSYVEIGFKATAGTLFAFDNIAGSGDMQMRIHPADYHSTWNPSQADDPSFMACTGTAFMPRPGIAGFYMGQLAWGTTP